MADQKKLEASDPIHALAQAIYVAMMAQDPTQGAADPGKRASQAYDFAEAFLAKRKAMTKDNKNGVGFRPTS